MFFKSKMPVGTPILFSNGNRGILLSAYGTFLTFGRVDKNGNKIFQRSRVSTFKQKLFSISKDSLIHLIKLGDIKL
jgi:hypothetical protein